MYRSIQGLLVTGALVAAGASFAQDAMSPGHGSQMAAMPHGHAGHMNMGAAPHGMHGGAGTGLHGAAPGAAGCGHEGMVQRHARPGHGPMSHNMAEHAAKRQEMFKAQLQLKPTQDAAWAAFVSAMKEPGRISRPQPLNPLDLAKMSTPERLDAMQAQRERHRAEREAAMKTRNQAVKTFYATLEPDQKKVFDALSMRWMGAMMRGGQGRPHAHDAEHDMQGHHRG